MKKIFDEIIFNKRAMLGAGPMSTNSVNAIIELSDLYKIPVQLIASRRQVDSEYHGGGYVNNWTTSEFADYVNKTSKNKLVFISRDHSGPWQGYYEVDNNLDAKKSMESSKKSLESDIDNGFKFLHLDPSIDIHNKIKTEIILERLFELYNHIYEYSNGLKDIYVEIGTDLQSDRVSSLEETEFILEKILDFTKNEINHNPSFYVIQNGTKVLEMENVGEYKDKILKSKKFQNQIINLNKLINSYGLLSKAHNCDYLDFEILNSLPEFGINGVNIAPEYGVAESKAIVRICKEFNLGAELEKFLNLSYSSMKWEKWLKPDTSLSDQDKAVISGHYIFANQEFLDLKKQINSKLQKHNIEFNSVIYRDVYNSVKNSLKGLNWIKE